MGNYLQHLSRQGLHGFRRLVLYQAVKGGQQNIIRLKIWFPIMLAILYLEGIINLQIRQQHISTFLYLLIINLKLLYNFGSNYDNNGRIDSWNNEYLYVIVDNYLWSKSYHYSEGTQICGKRSDLPDTTTQITMITNHYSKQLLFLMTSNLDDNDEESWGFRDFTLSILRCPQGCLYCQDNDYNNCYYWIDFYPCGINQQNLKDG
ncbi:unnamed protein product [Paramecium octaurelia]|uniref:Uncharacterized protein n=1 Tax=Paramecium octaurelia TaxID=43137 RepID=A0A8S1TQ11_PAROT|nr:unnamed protein product [Paramecium octaurelia]